LPSGFTIWRQAKKRTVEKLELSRKEMRGLHLQALQRDAFTALTASTMI